MEYEKISEKEHIFSYELTCPFCSEKYSVAKTVTVVEGGSEFSYDNYPDCCGGIFSRYCEHLVLWENEEGGIESSEAISELEWFTRMADIPFRVWDVLQEVINNDYLPEGCEVRIRAFYGYGYIVYVFCNDPGTLAEVVLKKTKEYIRKYHEQYTLSNGDAERFSKILE